MKRKKTPSTLLRLLSFVGCYPIRSSLVLLGIVIQVLLTVYLPILIGRTVDLVLLPNSMLELQETLLIMMGVIALNTLLQWGIPIVINQMIYQFVGNLRQRVFEHLHSLPFSYLDSQNLGDIVSRISTDAEQLTNGLLMIFNQFLVGILTVFLMIISMMTLDIYMMLVVVFLTPLSLFVAHIIAKKSYFYYQKQTISRGRQSSFLEESVSQISLLQIFNAQEQFQAAFEELNEDYAVFSVKAIFSSSTVNPTTRFINAVIYALLAGMGALRIFQGNFSIGALTTFLNYANQYTKPFNDISSVLSEMQSALACAERLFTILDETTVADTGTLSVSREQVLGRMTFQSVSFSYQASQPLIEEFSLDIPAGSKVAIVGPTGAGKSTLINLLMRFYEVKSGQILLDGVPINQYLSSSFREQIGMVLQETWIKNGTIHDNIAYGSPDVAREQVIEAAKSANADFFIQALPDGYDTYLTDGGENLSQGQRQLLAIARVFVKHPNILILDEATSSIDTRTELLIQEAFEKLMENRTSFMIAHRLSTIQSADIILVMNQGKVIEQGSHDTLMAQKGLYYQMQSTK